MVYRVYVEKKAEPGQRGAALLQHDLRAFLRHHAP